MVVTSFSLAKVLQMLKKRTCSCGDMLVSPAPGAESDMLCLVVRLLAQQRFRSTRLVIMWGSQHVGVFSNAESVSNVGGSKRG